MNVSEFEEAELKVNTVLMYENGGVHNVLNCLNVMQQCQTIILTKLIEILDNESKK